MPTFRHILSAALVISGFTAPALPAQQQDPQQQQQTQQQNQQQTQQQGQQQPQQQQTPNQPAQPIPAYRSPLALGSDNSEPGSPPDALVPDTRPLAGALDLTIGAPKTAHDFWTPYFDVSSAIDSNPLSPTGGTGWTTWTSFLGGVNLNRISGNSDLVLTYLGGDSVSTGGGSSNAVMQELGIVDRISFHRTAVTFLDQLVYLPEVAFGYAGLGGPDLANGGSIGLSNGFAPNQSILTALGQRVSNSFATEVDGYLTPRSSITAVGSYGLLDFFGNPDANLNNSKEATAQVGYNYLLSRKDTIAVIYRFDALRYDHITQSINDNSVQLSYARRLTGRMALQLSGGPDIAFSQTPLPGSLGSSTPVAVTPGSTPGKTRQFFWDLNSFLTYQLKRASIGLAYSHGVTGGSGVLAGAVTDNVNGSVSRQFTPTVTGDFSFGYSRNNGLTIIQTTLTPAQQTFNYFFAGADVHHTFGRALNVFVGYQANYQNSNAQFCIISPCSTSYIQHQISITFGWHPRPITF